VRKLLSYLPNSNAQLPPRPQEAPKAPGAAGKIAQIIAERATKAYDMHDIIGEVFDAGSFLEVHQE
jgi:acetyl-CoA carboxylase carboxyltransferase component